MYKKGIVLAISVLTCALYAQGKEFLEKEDILQAFEQYNAGVLEQAKTNQTYNEIFQKLTTSFKVPDTVENQAEMIALVKNFDNSLQLYVLGEAYQEARLLQLASGASLDTLDANMAHEILPVLQDIYHNTLVVKKIQIGLYKQKIKEVKKNKELTREAQKEQIAQWKAKIKQTKTDISNLKKNATAQINNTANQYMKDMQAVFEQSQAKQLKAEQATAQDVKANNKKPVAK